VSCFAHFEVSDPRHSPAGLQCVTVRSAALGRRADLTLFLPAGAQALRDLPLVLLLHGVYGSHWSWALQGGAHHTLARLVAVGRVPPMVLVMPSDGLWGDGSGYVKHDGGDFEQWIVEEVPAAATLACPQLGARSPRFIAGLSMGGFAALRLAGRYPQRFRAASGHSSLTDLAQLAPLVAESPDHWPRSPVERSVLASLVQASAPLPPLRFDCGVEDGFLEANRALHGALETAGIAHRYEEFPGGHTWLYWEQQLERSLLFFAGQSWEGRDPPA
jgi:enterochelin esterase-like enzyme